MSVHREFVQASGTPRYLLKPYGFIESIELRPRGDGPNGLVPAMNAAQRTELYAELVVDGRLVPCDVIVNHRSIDEEGNPV